MRYNTTLGDDNTTKELVQLLIVADGELQVARNDTKIIDASMITCAKEAGPMYAPLFLVITCSIARKLKNLSSQVFEDRGKVDGSTSPDTLSIVAALEHTVDTTDGELKTGF